MADMDMELLQQAPDPSGIEDLPLLAAVLERNERAWRELIRRYRSLIYSCIGRVAARYDALLSSEDVNEIFGEVCVNVLRDDMRKLRAFDPTRGCKLGSWIGMLAIHTSYDFLRVSRRHPVHDDLEAAPERAAVQPSALDELIDRERWHRLNALMAGFSDKDRRFVELYYGRGLLPEEVASAMSISLKTVYSKKNKVRNKLAALARTRRAEPLPRAA